MFTAISRKTQNVVCMILSAVIVSVQPVARCLRRRTRCTRRLLGDDHADPVSPRPLPALPFKARRQALAPAAVPAAVKGAFAPATLRPLRYDPPFIWSALR